LFSEALPTKFRHDKLETLTAQIDFHFLEGDDPGLSLRPRLGKQRVEKMSPGARRARRQAQNFLSSQRARTWRKVLREKIREQLAKMRMTLAGLTTEAEDLKKKRKSEL